MALSHMFTGITSEGGLLPSDFLAALGDPKSGREGLDPVTYRLAPGERLGDQVNRSWNRLKGCWVNFQRAIMTKQPGGEPTTTETRERWLYPLFQELDFGRLTGARPIEIDGKSYPVSHGWGPVPIHLVGTHVDLDHRTPGAVGAAKASPHSLVQQVINASDDHLWGIISNGFTFRLVRDNVTLTRIAYIEWDLQTIFEGDLYPEFFLLWLVCHQSRFEAPADGRPDQCWLEKWKKQAVEKGLRALENLRPGVEKAIAALGVGLVSHKANQDLRSSLSVGQLSTQDFYRQILRVVYRMLFLFVAEDRGLLHPPLPGEDSGREAMEAAIKARRRYQEFYSLGRLRDLTLHRAGTPHPDLWSVFNLVSRWLGSDNGCPELALPSLGSFLWSPQATPDLNDCLVSNRHLLEAIHALAFVREGKVRRTIDYKNMGSEELGSVYEGLLEQHPVVNADAGTFDLQTAAGHERKTSGSYYTPDSLVQCLLDSALEPVMAAATRGKEGNEAAHALLKLRVCDPAVGSGHFLIAAAHRMARRIAAARTGEEEPSPGATRSALRDVIGRCLYGVDVNPMAAELCKVSLWLEALQPGKPLSFLDHHIRVGNSLLGATPELIAKGIPDEAFKPIEGDDKKACSALKKRNAAERRGIGGLFIAEDTANQEALRRSAFAVEEIEDDTPDEVRRKAEAFEESQKSYGYVAAKSVADAWCAAFVIKKTFKPGTTRALGITQDYITDLSKGNPLPADLDVEVQRLSREYQFFHWHLAFPEVFATRGAEYIQESTPHPPLATPYSPVKSNQGGFDVVLGNPPWERVKLQEKEWFAERSPEIANAPNAAARKLMINELKAGDPLLYQQFLGDSRKAEGESHLLRHCGRYPLCGRGDINVYTVFAEGMRSLLSDRGRVGCVLPTGIATDDTTKFFFQKVVETKSLVCLFDFENKGIFSGVHSSFKFCLFTSGRGIKPTTQAAEFVFFAHSVEDLCDPARRFRLSFEELTLLSPISMTMVAFRSAKDKEATLKLYRSCAQVTSGERNSSGGPLLSCNLTQGTFHSSNDSRLFSAGPEGLPREGLVSLFEPRLFHLFDHRYSTWSPASQFVSTSIDQHRDPFWLISTRYRVPKRELISRLRSERDGWVLAYRRVARSTDERTMICTIIPTMCINENGVFIRSESLQPMHWACVCSNLASFCLDYCLRQRDCFSIGNADVQQQPLLSLSVFERPCAWSPAGHEVKELVLARILELTYTAWDLDLFAKDCGWNGPPFRWNEDRRFLLRSELDAAFFHLYLPATADGQWKSGRIAEGAVRDETPEELAELKRHFSTPRDAVAYILDTFPIVKRKDEEKHGEYRTKRVILEIYDEMAGVMAENTIALAAGRDSTAQYQTCLDPPPGPPMDAAGNFIPMAQWKILDPHLISHIHPPMKEVRRPEEVPLEEFAAMAYPATDTDKAICAAALAIVSQSGVISSTDHLDTLLLATHPNWCRVFLDENEHRAFNAARNSAPQDLFVSGNQSIQWKECRDYLEVLQAITVNRRGTGQAISPGARLVSVRNNLLQDVDEIVRLALKAIGRIAEHRRDPSSVPQDQLKIMRVFEEQHRLYELAA